MELNLAEATCLQQWSAGCRKNIMKHLSLESPRAAPTTHLLLGIRKAATELAKTPHDEIALYTLWERI